MSSTRDFSGKVVIVTGSSAGIGEEIAIQFSKLGANVVVTGRNADNVRRVADICQSVSPNGLKPLVVIADITNDEEAKNLIESTIKEFGKIDILVNNAASSRLSSIVDPNCMDVFDKVMRLNVRSVVYLTHLAVPYLELTKGNIVNISSITGLKPIAIVTQYCMSKSALDMFTKCLAIELGPKGIRVNTINPGVIRTDFQLVEGFTVQQVEQLRESYASRAPLRVIGEPIDIANGVVFLASNEAKFITGANIVIEGGALYA